MKGPEKQEFNRLRGSVLVTGIHRSGSTFTGQMLSQAPNRIYIHEPFQVGLNFQNAIGPFTKWYEKLDKITTDNKQEKAVLFFINYLTRITKADFKELKTKQLKKLIRSLRNIYNKITFGKKTQIIIKDPIAFFSADWLYQTIPDLKVIVIVRHPAAFVSSIKELNWNFDFENLLSQENLNEFMAPFREEISEIDKNNIVDVGALLWKIIYTKAIEYQKHYGHEWLFVKYEDMMHEPLKWFDTLYRYIGNTPSPELINYIKKNTLSSKNKGLQKNSQVQINKWEKKLEQDEKQRIQNLSGEPAKYWGYYNGE